MASLPKELRRELERTAIEARRVGEEGARKALKSLAVDHHEPWSNMTADQRGLRTRLRAHGRLLGDRLDERRGTQTIEHLAGECAYEHWHRMLFARFLAENNLLIEPKSNLPITLEECRELAIERETDWLTLASDFAVRMLLQVFRKDDPVLEVTLAPEARHELEELLKALSVEVFTADDSLGWVYQFWQSERKDEINASGEKIGADQLAAVTQLFTEDYMVLFLLHNTLGAWWTTKRKAEGRDPTLPGYEWTYLRLTADGAPAAGSFGGWPRVARDLKILDPSMGSGHFLVFALPILVGFRMLEEGLSREEAVEAVLRENLFGLEIDNRCTQIAAFNLAFMAWRLVGHRTLPPLNVACSGLGISVDEADWVKLAGKDGRLRETMQKLYALFSQAPILGSLIDPRRFQGTLFTRTFEEVRSLLERALSLEQADEVTSELAVAAQGIVKAMHILADTFTLIATNVPYLGSGKQIEAIKTYCGSYSPDGSADLATVFIDRCAALCCDGGTHAIVTPQNWLFLGSYRDFRVRLMKSQTLNHVAQVGSGATSTASWDVVRALTIISREKPKGDYTVTGIETDAPNEEQRAVDLRLQPLLVAPLSALEAGPDARIALGFADQQNRRLVLGLKALPLLQEYATAYQGIVTADYPRFGRFFWEIPRKTREWEFQQSTVEQTTLYKGREHILLWESGKGELANSESARVQGLEALGKQGVTVVQMRDLPVTLFTGEFFDNNCSAMVVKDVAHLPAVWAFCSHPEFARAVRTIDTKLNVTNATLVKVPFDLAYWQAVAAEKYPQGMPNHQCDDPTQWVFSGDPKASVRALQVAVARLLDYGWPRQTGSNFVNYASIGPDDLVRHSDPGGIVCLNSVKGEMGAAERLRAFLGEAFGGAWSASKQAELISQIGYTGKTLEDWLRDCFFEQHCELFHQRPFVWHIWDGLRDGFHALVNYHRLAGTGGEGRRTLEKLIYTYLGDWIDRQRADQKSGVEGADARVAAAVHLQSELKKILAGEPPYDIFVRWKPLHEQLIGWEPDINDGVRINIRPFLTAKVLNGRGKSSCILRTTPKIKWEKDRGKEPHRTKEDFPWFWSWDETTNDFAGGRDFDAGRWNDLHYSTKRKQEARDHYASSKKGGQK